MSTLSEFSDIVKRQSEENRNRVESIDMTPTWSALLPSLLACYDQRAVAPKRFAIAELERMAALADKYVEQHTQSLRPNVPPTPTKED